MQSSVLLSIVIAAFGCSSADSKNDTAPADSGGSGDGDSGGSRDFGEPGTCTPPTDTRLDSAGCPLSRPADGTCCSPDRWCSYPGPVPGCSNATQCSRGSWAHWDSPCSPPDSGGGKDADASDVGDVGDVKGDAASDGGDASDGEGGG